MHDLDLDRRRFLGLTGAGVALGAPGVALGAAPPVDLERALSIERALLGGDVAPAVPTAAGWDADKLFNEAAATLMWSDQVRQASATGQASPELQSAIEARAGGMMRAMWAAALELDALDEAGLAEMEALIVEDPSLVRESELRFTIRALEHEVAADTVRKVDRALDDALWRIKHRGLASVREDLIRRVDKAARRDGVDWRAEARRGAQLAFIEQPAGDVVGADPNPEAAALEKEARRKKATGLSMLIGGIVWMAGPQIVFGGICFGPPLIIIGIVKLVAAGRKRREAEALRAQAAP